MKQHYVFLLIGTGAGLDQTHYRINQTDGKDDFFPIPVSPKNGSPSSCDNRPTKILTVKINYIQAGTSIKIG